mgnify:CR=1 FL=1
MIIVLPKKLKELLELKMEALKKCGKNLNGCSLMGRIIKKKLLFIQY